jgi:hypothetical protein
LKDEIETHKTFTKKPRQRIKNPTNEDRIREYNRFFKRGERNEGENKRKVN